MNLGMNASGARGNNILVISARQAFISKALQKNLKDAGYEVFASGADVESISSFSDMVNIQYRGNTEKSDMMTRKM